MKTSYDAKVDAAYIHITANHNPITETAELSDSIFVDYDADGRPIGVEILDAKKMLPEKVFRYLKDHQTQAV